MRSALRQRRLASSHARQQPMLRRSSSLPASEVPHSQNIVGWWFDVSEIRASRVLGPGALVEDGHESPHRDRAWTHASGGADRGAG